MRIRAGIYTRISDARDGDTAGVDRQLEDCLALCADRGWTVVTTYEDNNVSAMKSKARLAYGELLNDVREGHLDVVVTWASDRLYRRLSDLEELTKVLGSVTVATVKSGKVDLSTADGILMANLLGSVSQHESQKRGERVARAASQRAQEGRYNGGQRRFGYNPTATELKADEADAVREAYRHVAAGGTLESIVRDWRERFGVGTLGGKITGTQVREILLRPLNAGIAVYRGKEVGRTKSPVIIDEDTWRSVIAILSDPARRTTVGKPATTLLSGVMRCGICGERMGSRWRKRRSNGKDVPGERVQSYTCREGHISRSLPHMDEAARELVAEYLAANAEQLRRPVTSTKSDSAMEEAEKLRARLDGLAQLAATGELDPADYAAATRGVRERLSSLETRLAKAAGTPATSTLITAGDIRKAWAAADTVTQRAIIKELVERIEVTKEKPGAFTMRGVEIIWRHAS
jgi:DNA invertase Pin-like site-specific DNA recombinase